MNDSSSDSSNQPSSIFSWRWFLMGCGCLLVGGLYLGFVDLNPVSTATETAPEQNSFTSDSSVGSNDAGSSAE